MAYAWHSVIYSQLVGCPALAWLDWVVDCCLLAAAAGVTSSIFVSRRRRSLYVYNMKKTNGWLRVVSGPLTATERTAYPYTAQAFVYYIYTVSTTYTVLIRTTALVQQQQTITTTVKNNLVASILINMNNNIQQNTNYLSTHTRMSLVATHEQRPIVKGHTFAQCLVINILLKDRIQRGGECLSYGRIS